MNQHTSIKLEVVPSEIQPQDKFARLQLLDSVIDDCKMLLVCDQLLDEDIEPQPEDFEIVQGDVRYGVVDVQLESPSTGNAACASIVLFVDRSLAKSATLTVYYRPKQWLMWSLLHDKSVAPFEWVVPADRSTADKSSTNVVMPDIRSSESEAASAALALRPLISMRDIAVTYGKGSAAVPALKNVSLDIHAREMTLLLGPSGSGKTSLLQVMGCLLTPTSGTLHLFDAEVKNETPESLAQRRLQNFGFIFQHYNLFPTLRAWENVAIALDLKGIPAEEFESRARALMERLGIGDRANAFPAELSGGQKQRVAIARALAGKPQILLADEPTAALDSKTGKTVAGLLHDLAHEENCAIVVVTHDPRMLPFGDRVVTLEDGLLTSDHRPAQQPGHNTTLDSRYFKEPQHA
jgi:putative ABC transport system ATP-binding protein